MKRIIRHGQIESIQKLVRFECKNCSCIYDADKDEYNNEYDVAEKLIFKCNCPECNSINLSVNKIAW